MFYTEFAVIKFVVKQKAQLCSVVPCTSVDLITSLMTDSRKGEPERNQTIPKCSFQLLPFRPQTSCSNFYKTTQMSSHMPAPIKTHFETRKGNKR